MGSYEEFMKAWNYIWQMGNEVVEYSPFLAERDMPKTAKLHEELLKLKAAFEDAQEEWWTQNNEKRRKDEEEQARRVRVATRVKEKTKEKWMEEINLF